MAAPYEGYGKRKAGKAEVKHLLSLTLTVLLVLGCLSTTAFAEESTEVIDAQIDEILPEDPEGTVSWANLDQRIRAGSLHITSLLESIKSVEAIDYEKMYDDLRKQLNSIAGAQWAMAQAGSSSAADSMQSTYDALRDTFDSIKDGELQADHADMIWQLKDAVNQIVVAGENLYISILGLELSVQDAARNLAAIDRQLEEMKVRQQLGLASAQAVADLQQSRLSAESQLQSLNDSISIYKGQLQTLLGAERTGVLTLAPLPDDTRLEWTALDPQADLASAKEVSWTLRNARITLEDAEDTWKDARKDYTALRNNYQLEVAEHTWNAAQATYQAAVQDFESSFDTLYRSLSQCEQVWNAKQSALSYQELLLNTVCVKYELGRASYYDVLTAEDNVAAARSEVQSAWYDLFSARNDYYTAVTFGIL